MPRSVAFVAICSKMHNEIPTRDIYWTQNDVNHLSTGPDVCLGLCCVCLFPCLDLPTIRFWPGSLAATVSRGGVDMFFGVRRSLRVLFQ